MEGKTPPSSILNFIFGGSAGMLACFVVHPMDVIKNRMQIQTTTGNVKAIRVTKFQLVQNIARNEGIAALYSGISASLLRQSTYTATRLGVYNFLVNRIISANGSQPTIVQKVGIGVVSGICGAIVGTPAELCLIRMTADVSLPLPERRHYKHVFNAIGRIAHEEGVRTLWCGCLPTVARAIVSNVTQLITYSEIKESLINKELTGDDFYCHFWSSMISGFATAVTTMPMDIVKTRVQSSKSCRSIPEYKISRDIFKSILRNEGPLAFWKGFTPYYIRIGPQTMLTFILMEQLLKMYNNFT